MRQPAASMTNAKPPARRVASDGDDNSPTDGAKESPKETEATIDDDDDDDDEALDEDVDRRSRFTLKGASHSIKKVLAGKARTSKKDAGLSRLDRRRIQLKSKSTPSADMDVPSPVAKSPGTSSVSSLTTSCACSVMVCSYSSTTLFNMIQANEQVLRKMVPVMKGSSSRPG